MIKLEIQVLPIKRKQVEFSQTLESIKNDLQEHCSDLIVTQEENIFFFRIEFKSENRLNEILQCKELSILSGAIRSLAEESEITIQDNEDKKKWSDIDKARLYYVKDKGVTKK